MRKTGGTHYNINWNNIFLDPPPKVIKTKINKWDPFKLKSFCTKKCKQNENHFHKMGDNICKQRDQQRINLQNTPTAHAAQYKKINNSTKK